MKYSRDPILFYVECFHKAIDGLGTNEYNLIRLIVVHVDTDLVTIDTEYQRIHHRSLHAVITTETSGSLRLLLLALLAYAHRSTAASGKYIYLLLFFVCFFVEAFTVI